MKTFWLSFCPEGGPGRVVLLDAEDEVVARLEAHLMKLYRPGDQLLIIEMTGAHADELALPRNRELTEEELASVQAVVLGDVDRSVS